MNLPLTTVPLADSTADCKRAQDLVQKQKIPEPCKTLKNIEFGFTLDSSFLGLLGEGTDDIIGATLGGSAGTAELKLAESPSGGASAWVAVDMQEAFQSDSVDINKINNLTITAKKTGLSKDAFKVKGKSGSRKTRLAFC